MPEPDNVIYLAQHPKFAGNKVDTEARADSNATRDEIEDARLRRRLDALRYAIYHPEEFSDTDNDQSRADFSALELDEDATGIMQGEFPSGKTVEQWLKCA